MSTDTIGTENRVERFGTLEERRAYGRQYGPIYVPTAREAFLAAAAERRQALLEDVEILVKGGTPYDEVPSRIGMSHGALERALFRHAPELRRRWRDTGPNADLARAIRDGHKARRSPERRAL